MERIYAERLGHYIGIKHYWEIPLQLTLRGELVSGLFGPVFLLVPLSLLALRLKYGRRLLAAALVFAVPAYLNTDARFLIPCAPFLAMSLGLALAESPRRTPGIGFVSGVGVLAACPDHLVPPVDLANQRIPDSRGTAARYRRALSSPERSAITP